MKIVIDTNVLVQIMQNVGAKDLIDPETGNVVVGAFDRAQALVERIDALKGVVVLPAPVVCEYLLGIDRNSYQAHLDVLNGFSCIEVFAFDQAAAIECALLVTNQEMKQLDPDSKMAKLKYHLQILAIAVASGAKEIWTHDRQLYRRCAAMGLVARSLAAIDPTPRQLHFNVDA